MTVIAVAALFAAPLVAADFHQVEWNDCNEDGYVGFHVHGNVTLDPYPELLPYDISRCQMGSPWNPGDGWIYELGVEDA